MINRFILLTFFIMLLACSEEPTLPKSGTDPQIVEVRLKDRWNLNSADSNVVEVKVSDPQGFADLDTVVMQVYNSTSDEIFKDYLYDDGGLSGSTDLIAGDGVFRNVFPINSISDQEADYLFTFNITDKMGNSAEEVSKIVSFRNNLAPLLISATTPDTLKIGSKSKIIRVIAVDPDGKPQQTNVYMDMLYNGSSIFLDPVVLANDGNVQVNGDDFASDSVYSLKIDSSFAAGKQGVYTMVFSASDEFGSESNVIQNEIQIENEPPFISDLSAPSSIDLPTGQQIVTALITLKVNDSQGLTDIDSVYFNSIKPDGSPANGNPFIMLDNGIPFDINNFVVARGDEIANDGTFSITILLDSSNDVGVYEFTFWARDRAGHRSNSITHNIEVK